MTAKINLTDNLWSTGQPANVDAYWHAGGLAGDGRGMKPANEEFSVPPCRKRQRREKQTLEVKPT